MNEIGKRLDDLDTPVLVVDLDAMERNIARMATFIRDHDVSWRPHTKGIKIPALAERLLEAGAIGITCAKLSEAEVMAAAGMREILVANQVVGAFKVRRLADLCGSVHVMVAVDSGANVAEIGAAATAAGTHVDLVIEVNIGLNRAGVEPGDPAVQLARVISRTAGVRLAGVMGWEGHAQTASPPGEKRRAIESAVGELVATADAIRSAGLAIEIVSCGGTATYRETALQPGITEIQAGGGIFGDAFYRTNGAESECALTVIATVTSRPTRERVITDAGKKTMSVDMALPEPIGVPAQRVRLSAEHSTIDLKHPSELPRVGDRLTFIVGYEDTTVCLHDRLVGARGGRVEAIWPVAGRGKIQ